MRESEITNENLRKWFKEKWVRFGPDGKIRGACARGDDSEGKPKCLPQAKAHALGKKGRKYAAAKKRREDPNPERRGPAKNVATKKKSNESLSEAVQNFDKQFGVPLTPQGAQAFMKQPTDQRMKAFQAAKAAGYKYDNQTGVFTAPSGAAPAATLAKKTPPVIPGKKSYGAPKPGELGKGLKRSELPVQQPATPAPAAQPAAAQPAQQPTTAPKLTSAERQAQWDKEAQERRQQALKVAASLPKPIVQPPVAKPATSGTSAQVSPGAYKAAAASAVDTDDADDIAQTNKFLQQQAAAGNQQAAQALALRKQQGLAEDQAPMFTPESKCPHCGGKMFSEELMNEKKDACYYKVKSRYKVWPSAYASGALVKCRKKGASNWGTGGKKNEGVAEEIEWVKGKRYKIFIRDENSGRTDILGYMIADADAKVSAALDHFYDTNGDPGEIEIDKYYLPVLKAGKLPKNYTLSYETMESAQGMAEGNDQEFHTGGSKGLPMPGTYEQENNMFKRHGTRRITAMTNEDEAVKDLSDSLADLYKEKVKFNKKPIENYDEVAQQLVDKASDPKVKQQIVDIVKKGKDNPYLQGGIITTVGALLAGGVLSLGSKYGLNPSQTNMLLQGILNTVIPTLVSRINGKNWKDTIKYTLASAGTGTGIAALTEKWSEKYKRSIDCSHPKGFSQRAHCQGRKKK